MIARDYQQEDLDKTVKAYESGETALLGTWPTGAGKGFVLAKMPEAIRLERGQQLVTVVDRKELVNQLAEKLTECNPTLKVDVERASFSADRDADIIVASVQSMGGAGDESTPERYSDRLKKFDRDRVRCVVVDETHTAPKSEGYARILKYFGCFKGDPRYRRNDRLLMGLTATAFRSDGIGLETMYDKIIFRRDLRNSEGTGLMETGLTIDGGLSPWLCGIKSYRVDTEVNIDEVATARGDLAVGALEKTINTPERNWLIVDKYLELGEDMRFFAFTVDVEHSQCLQDAFQERGIKAYVMSGSTSDNDRRKLMDAFRIGQIKGLISCGVLSTGIDLPMVGCLLMGRPTKSKLLYIQQTGRGLRPFPAPERMYDCWKKGMNPGWVKPYCVTIDFVDVSSRHSLIHAPTLFGLRADFDMKGRAALDVMAEVERIKAAKPALNMALYTDLDSIRGVAEKIDLFATPTIADEVRQYSQFSWVTGVTPGSYQLNLPDKGMITIRQNALGQFEIFRHMTGVRSPMGSAGTIAEALKTADKEVPREAMVMLKSDAAWRGLPISEKQIALFRKLYPELRKPFASDTEFVSMVNARYTRGDLSMLISQRATR